MRNKIIGGVVGGAIGFIIGAIVADSLYPEYYKPGEDFAYPGVAEYRDPAISSDGEPSFTKSILVKKGKGPTKVVDYARFGAAAKTPLADIVKKRREEADIDFDEKVLRVEENLEANPSLYEDYSDLTQIRYEENIVVRDTSEPYFLSSLEFEDLEADDPNMPITNLSYFTEDDVLVRSSDNRPLDVDPVKLIGEHALSPRNFGLFGNIKDIVYIYNPNLDGIYRILSIHESFEDVMAGSVKETKHIKLKEEDDE